MGPTGSWTVPPKPRSVALSSSQPTTVWLTPDSWRYLQRVGPGVDDTPGPSQPVWRSSAQHSTDVPCYEFVHRVLIELSDSPPRLDSSRI